jgi:hypothetical protein
MFVAGVLLSGYALVLMLLGCAGVPTPPDPFMLLADVGLLAGPVLILASALLAFVGSRHGKKAEGEGATANLPPGRRTFVRAAFIGAALGSAGGAVVGVVGTWAVLTALRQHTADDGMAYFLYGVAGSLAGGLLGVIGGLLREGWRARRERTP